MARRAAVAMLLSLSVALVGTGALANNTSSTSPDIRALEIRSDVRYRYARTEVFSRVANPANESQEVTFKALLPEDAFISSFAITVGGRVYPARVEGREEARQEYQEAVSAGRTAAHVQVNARHANLFTVSLNVAANDKAAFNLTYEQLLSRERGRYRLRIMLDPRQVVQRLLVEARIRDSANLTLVRVANLRAADNEVDYAAEEPEDPLATVVRLAPGEALVRWEPDEETQRSLEEEDGAGLRGLLEVQYDVDRSSASELLVGDGGYFVHFFSPSDDELPILAKHVVFLLDVSGSMAGRKIEQLKEAMVAILAELHEGDAFSLLTFSSVTRVWMPDQGFRLAQGDLRNTVVPATRQAIAQAQEAARGLRDDLSTYMYEALQTAFSTVRHGREQMTSGGERQPLIIFLTDGRPNGQQSAPEELLGVVSAATANSSTYAPLYSLAFGNDADFELLKKLSLRGKGFARKIYEAADAALQLRNFYRRVASPLLANVTFQYADDQVESSSLTQTAFSVLLAGTELSVAGRLVDEDETGESGHLATVLGMSADHVTVETPAIALRLDKQQSTFMERLWAYLTVRQLLERANGDDAEARERARQLALRYSFVTSLTSLVVVKPDDLTDVPDLRDASLPFAKVPAVHKGGRRGRIRSRVLSARKVFGDSHELGMRIAPTQTTAETYDAVTVDSSGSTEENEKDATHFAGQLPAPTYLVVPLANLTWLSDGVAGNGSHVFISDAGQVQVFLVEEPEEILNFDVNCTDANLPRTRGDRCLPLARCALQELVQDFTAFRPRFCPIGSHAGICCPWLVVRSLRWADSAKEDSKT